MVPSLAHEARSAVDPDVVMSELWKILKGAWRRATQRPFDEREPIEGLPFAVRYERVFESLQRADLQREEDDDAVDLSDLFDTGQGGRRFLNLYSEPGALMAFERYGFFDLLRERGIEPLLTSDLSDPDEHRFRIYDEVEAPERLVIELVAGLRDITLPDGAKCHMLFLNWLLMQNPNEAFTDERQALPGQAHPGLGLFIHFGYLLRLMAIRLGCDGLLNHPSYFHNGVLYGKFSHFVDPLIEGRMLALQRDLANLSLTESTVAVRDGRVVDERGRVFTWEPAPQVMPITEKARAWFESENYRALVERARDAHRFRILD